MITVYKEKNQFGGSTEHIKLDSLFHIFIHGTDDGSFLVEFKEWRFVNYKVRFSFVSSADKETAVVETFERMYDYFKKNKNYSWTVQKKENLLNQVLIQI